MRIAAHYRKKNIENNIVFRMVGNIRSAQPLLEDIDRQWNHVYGSLIFERTKPLAESIVNLYPNIVLGGTGWNITSKLEDYGITTIEQDYSIYPQFKHSIGFSQRGCRLSCSFCVVPRKEGKVRTEQTINSIWRGSNYPKNIILLDNDFFGDHNWKVKIKEIIDGGFKVNFNQGINARLLYPEAAEALAGIPYYDANFKSRKLYTAWDNKDDEDKLFKGLNLLTKYGIKASHIMVYVLIYYWSGETHEDRLYRIKKLRDFGCNPYPIPFTRNKESVGFQTWILERYDKFFTFEEFAKFNYTGHNIKHIKQYYENNNNSKYGNTKSLQNNLFDI